MPASRTWTLIQRSGLGLVGDETKTITVGTAETYAIDFRKDLPVNGRVITVTTIAIQTGAAGGVTFGTAGRDRTQAKARITAVTAGTYTIRCRVIYDTGASAEGDVVLKAID